LEQFLLTLAATFIGGLSVALVVHWLGLNK
jgi:hypothetical protein